MFTKPNKAIRANHKYYAVVEIKEVSGTGTLNVYSYDNGSKSQFMLTTANALKFENLKVGDIKKLEINSVKNQETLNEAVTMLRTFASFQTGQKGSITFRLSLLEDEPNLNNFVYTPHESQMHTIYTQQSFKSINNIRDRFVKKEKKWYEEHNIARFILTGTEDISLSGASNNIYQFNVNVQGIKTTTNENYENNVISNCFNYISYWTNSWLIDNIVLQCIGETNENIRFQTSDFTTVEDFKAMLAQKYAEGNAVYIDYVLAEPLLLECTAEQSAQLDALEASKNYKAGTIVYSTDEISPSFNITYRKDLASELDNIKQAVVALGGV